MRLRAVAPPARGPLGRQGHAARRLVAFRARPRMIDGSPAAAAAVVAASASAAAAPQPPQGVEPAAARGLRVCRSRRPASVMDLFGDLPEPERSPRPAAGSGGPLLFDDLPPAGSGDSGSLDASISQVVKNEGKGAKRKTSDEEKNGSEELVEKKPLR